MITESASTALSGQRLCQTNGFIIQTAIAADSTLCVPLQRAAVVARQGQSNGSINVSSFAAPPHGSGLLHPRGPALARG